MQICYDIRFPEITRILALQGAGIVTSVWASFGGQDVPVPRGGDAQVPGNFGLGHLVDAK
ncbi:nitrilase-related carbon-nitrogen hydrolase [Paracoccus mutanolyticus]|uniref:nitrilase-related carbon-nitrogen hydrolase n=1 Tax=Paracoccus mutanolyticus TaxID=1499308 RepID=UPI0021D53200|nr:nitrilase-related carbon-nitrogen hydrolase [Paracoccus mutanolyticus]